MNHLKKLVASLALSAAVASVGLGSAAACGGMATVAPPPFDPVAENPGTTIIGLRDPTTSNPGDPFSTPNDPNGNPNDPNGNPNDPSNGFNPDANPPSAGIDEVIL